MHWNYKSAIIIHNSILLANQQKGSTKSTLFFLNCENEETQLWPWLFRL